MCRSQSINYNKSTAIVRITCHERLRHVLQTCPIDPHPRPTITIDHRPTCSGSHTITVPALQRIHERLPRISMNYYLPTPHNPSHLVLSRTVNIHLRPIHA